MSGRDLTIRVTLSALRAFLGKVPPALRVVVISVGKEGVEVRCYFDGPIRTADSESISLVEAEMMADFLPASVAARCIRCDAPELIRDDGVWIYFRRER